MRLTTRTFLKLSPNPRWGFFVALSTLFLIQSLFAGTESNPSSNSALTFRTTDPLGNPIPYVSLILQPSQLWILSDEAGQFHLDRSLLKNDTLLVQRIGFVSRTVAVSELLSSGFIDLIPDMIQGQTVEVSEMIHRGTETGVLAHFAKSEGRGLMDHSQVLERIPGVSIRTYGGPAGISTMSMDGGPSSHTKVSVDDIDITSSQNGEADLSQLPLPFIESMTYVPYDITSGAAGSIDGQVKLSSSLSDNHISLSTGSYGHRAFDVGLILNRGGFQNYLQIGQRHETADYSYDLYSMSGTRSNNSLDQEFVSFKSSKLFSGETYLRFSGMQSFQSRGAAGLIWSPDTISHRKDMLRLLGTTLGQIRPNGNSQLKISYRQSSENYVNPYLTLDSDHALHSLQVGIRDERKVLPVLTVISDVNLYTDRINSSDANDHSRAALDGTLTAKIEFLKRLTLMPSLKSQFSPDLYHETFNDIQVVLELPLGPLKSLSVSQGHVFNYPSFNDLFWEPGGNPNLEPEYTEVLTIQSKLDFMLLGQLLLQWQSKQSENLIQWMPVHSYWQPSNVAAATRESQKVIWQIDLPNTNLGLYAHFAQIHTLDESLQNRLRYAPTRTSAASLSWSPGAFEAHLDYHYVSDRISMYSWPEDVMVPATELWSGSLGWTWETGPSHFSLVLSGDNLIDINYESIRGYPEPGRTYRITGNYSF